MKILTVQSRQSDSKLNLDHDFYRSHQHLIMELSFHYIPPAAIERVYVAESHWKEGAESIRCDVEAFSVCKAVRFDSIAGKN